MSKRTYETPAIAPLGSFEDITRGTDTGPRTDAVIPAGTPVVDIPGFLQHHLS